MTTKDNKATGRARPQRTPHLENMAPPQEMASFVVEQQPTTLLVSHGDCAADEQPAPWPLTGGGGGGVDNAPASDSQLNDNGTNNNPCSGHTIESKKVL